jgi:hypothetical protein
MFFRQPSFNYDPDLRLGTQDAFKIYRRSTPGSSKLEKVKWISKMNNPA